jgi:DNA-binding XRE family transcriptional regulator
MLSQSAHSASGLAQFLKVLRRRVDPNVRVLGPHARIPARVGKRVTQEELAEMIGISREWYAVLESAAFPRTSTRLLERLAEALMLTPAERTRLFQLGVPELSRMWRVWRTG